VLTLYQAEWCPYSSAVRELLTERGLDFVARQVEPHPEQRASMLERTGSDEIPVLELDDGRFLHGTDEVVAWVAEQPPSPYGESHRAVWAGHHPPPATRAIVQSVPAA
jgi:glutaredoxin